MKRQTAENVKTQDARGRVLFFDIIRILCVAVIIYDHSRFWLVPEFNQFFFPDGYGPFNIYPAGLQGYAVFGLIFVSGAVIEYTYRGLQKGESYLTFMKKRIFRIYPVFWMSLITMLLLFPGLLEDGIGNVLFEFTGFFIVLGQGPGAINPVGWFVGAIILLYFLYPWFSTVIRKYGLPALCGFWIMSWSLRYSIITYNLVPLDLFWRWFPLCNAFEFCLGIYLVQAAIYPKTGNRSPVVRNLADISYPAFLFHMVVVFAFLNYIPEPGSLPVAIAFYFVMIGSVIPVSEIVLMTDKRIQRVLAAKFP